VQEPFILRWRSLFDGGEIETVIVEACLLENLAIFKFTNGSFSFV
jgi:hypothetical protein